MSSPAKAAGKRAILDMLAPGQDAWVFGYGSLMWDPGFAHEEVQPALLYAYHRAFCIYSHRYRGTPERPGLVLGLDCGGSCRGRAYRVAGDRAAETLEYLWDREMVSGVYLPRRVSVRLARGRVECWTFVADRNHVQYAGALGLEEQVGLILQGCGDNGRCRDYLANTVRHLDELGIEDGPLHRLMALVEASSAENLSE
ncbi:MAG: gamma-glutamylcyclotransferase [Kiloniellales bacterium]